MACGADAESRPVPAAVPDLDHATLRVARAGLLRFEQPCSRPRPPSATRCAESIECSAVETPRSARSSRGATDVRAHRGARRGEVSAGGRRGRLKTSQQPFDRVARAHSGTVRLVAEDVAAALKATAAEQAHTCVTGH